MRAIRIEAYEHGEPDVTIKIPLALLRVAVGMFPRKCLASLERNALNLEDLLQAAANPELSGILVEIEDHKSGERLVVSVE